MQRTLASSSWWPN